MANQYDVADIVQGTVEGTTAGLSVADAALALATSKEAIRQRIRRGTLQATKVDGEWRITLYHQSTPTTPYMLPHGTTDPADATPYTTDRSVPTYTKPTTAHGTADPTTVASPSEAASSDITNQSPDETPAHVAAAYRELVAQVREENAFLKEELRRKDELFQAEQEAHRRDVSELHILLQRAQAQIPMPTLAAQPQEQTAEQPTPQEPRRRRWWWPFGSTS